MAFRSFKLGGRMNVKGIKKIGVLGMALSLAVACDESSLKTGVNLSIQGTTQEVGIQSLAALNPFNTGSKEVSLRDENGAIVGSIVLEEAYVALEEIEFENDIDLEDSELEGDLQDVAEEILEDSIEYEGPFLVDLINNTVTPSLDEVSIEPGRYNEIEMTLYPIGSYEDEIPALAEEGDAIFGRSIYLRGSYTGPSASGAQTSVPFEMSFNLNDEFEVEDSEVLASGLDINVGETARVTVAFRLQKWFEFSNAATNAGLSLSPSQIVIDNGAVDLTENGSNQTIRELVKNNILFSADYDDDDDDDDE